MNEIKSPAFFTGGNAIFTVSAPDTRYTFKIRQPEAREGQRRAPFFVSLLTGPDNMSGFTYLGIYNPATADKACALVRTAKSRMPEGARPVKAFAWAVTVIKTGAPLPSGYNIQHEGRCARCGRRLTVPESIDSGFGPECAERMAA